MAHVAETYGRRVTLLLTKGHFPAALRVVEEAERTHGRAREWDTSFAELGLDPHTSAALNKAGLFTPNDVRCETVKSLQEIRNIGRTGAQRVMGILERIA